jgi:penicillin-binding protein 2
VVTGVVVVAMFGALIVRLYVLQIQHGPAYNNQAVASTTRNVPVAPPRGEILARGGQTLAGNVASWQVTVDPSVVLDSAHGSTLQALASLLGVPVATMLNDVTAAAKITGPFVPVVVPTGPAGVTGADVTYIVGHPALFPGATASPGYKRSYPYQALGAQLLGYLSELTPGSQTGSSGLEAEYEAQLHGQPGSQTILVNRAGVFVGNGASTPAVAGDSVVLNMDIGTQEAATNALSAQLLALHEGRVAGKYEPAPWGAAIVMDNTGHVLAMVSLPSYDANSFVLPISTSKYNAILNAPGSPTTNYPIQGLQPPGSTFKLATATVALNSGLISPYQYIDDTGLFRYGTQTFSDSDGEVLGPVNVTTAIAQSSDYYFYNLGKLFWEQNSKARPIQNQARAYGITKPSGIDLPNGTYPNGLASEENLGWLDSPELRAAEHAANPKAFPNPGYYGGDSVQLAIGQDETDVTPLAMADAYQAFVNHGTRYAPELARAIVSPSGKVKSIAPRVMGHVNIPASTWNPMMAGFQGAVHNPKGTAYPAFNGFNFSKWDIAGKTGTADTNLPTPTAWFIGFGGPTGGATKYIVAVCINQAGFGATASAPVARTIFEYLQAHGVQAPTVP